MKLLLDENLPHDLRHFMAGHECFTVAFMGWRGVENGHLLAKAAENGFDVVLTKDTGVAYQQNIKDLPVALLIIKAKSNALDDIRPLVPAILDALASLSPNTLTTVGT
ncbi:MAG: DUF5615 family PIN-like protein [Phycisphaeraceae bacterium]|nr:DUF5615 family PIN-like protein [Phycisphaeraceae bacterium]MBX3368488.1 DUF5615 family PIN-like protein [Phycisphaeraceae bacterium]QYK47617.1 MAG: DUF5615 family PIN-like protein [Phycisphaeraceae bacterium]